VRRTALVAATLLAATALTASVAAAQTTTTPPVTTPGTTAPTTTTTTLPATALTRATISVGGVVDPAYAGAEVGAQARIVRANAQGGVGGRRIVYVGTSPDAKAATSGTVPISAVVPAAGATLDVATLAAAKVPFFGPADQAVWTGHVSGFGFAGAQVPHPGARTASPAWGITMKSLLGGAKGKAIAVASTAQDAAGDALAAQATAALRASGFTVPVPTSVAAGADPAATATALAQQGKDGVVLLTDPATTGSLATALAAQSYTGTVATSAGFYRPDNPAVAAGLTVMLPYAPPEQATAANKLLLADVEQFAPGTKVTPGVLAGYWAADEFVAALAKAGARANAAKLAATLRTFTYEVRGTVGPTQFPAAHAQPAPCGALVQSDGTVYLPVVTYRCGTPVKVAPAAAVTTTTKP
jgi:hypothetical protein